VRQPWAGLIALGQKDVENRTWLPELDIGSRFYIHVGRWDDKDRWRDLEIPAHRLFDTQGLVICTVRLVDLTRVSTSEWAVPGHWHWVLNDPKLIRSPRFARGRTGLWEMPPKT
jgi:hypothetical protein